MMRRRERAHSAATLLDDIGGGGLLTLALEVTEAGAGVESSGLHPLGTDRMLEQLRLGTDLIGIVDAAAG
jgi:hypothetical protein